MKRNFLISLIFFWIIIMIQPIISCSNEHQTPPTVFDELKEVLQNPKTILIKTYKESPDLKNPNIIKYIENNLELNTQEKSIIQTIQSNDNKLLINKITNVSFFVKENDFTTVKFVKKIMFYDQDESNIKNYKVYNIYTYNSDKKYLALTSDGLYTSDNLYTFNKVNLSKDSSVIPNCVSFYSDYIFIGTTKGVYFSRDNFKTINLLDNPLINELNITMLHTYGFFIYISTNNKLYLYNSEEHEYKIEELLNEKVNKIFSHYRSIFALTDKGLYLSNDLKKFHKIKNNSFQNSDVIVNDMLYVSLYDNDYLLLATNKGLYMRNISSSIDNKFYLVNTLENSDVLCLNFIKNILYIGTTNGLYISYDYFYKFNLDNIIKNISINSIITFENDYNNAYLLTNSNIIPDLPNQKTGMIYLNL